MDQQTTENKQDVKPPKGMSKNANGDKKRGPPEGMLKAKAELDAYWDPEDGPIYCIALSYKIFDSNIDKRKHATLITAELLEDATLREPDDKDVKRTFPKGTIFGIWGKPGMKELKQHGKVPVYIELAGEKDTGKGNPMKLFDVSFFPDQPGSRLVCTEDTREKSLPQDVRDARAQGRATSMEDVPF